MRLFIAINLGEEMTEQLLKLRDTLKERSERGNFSRRENIHLTLAFLGECDDRMADAAKKVMDGSGFRPFSLTVGTVGRFRKGRRDTWWAGVNSSKELSDLQKGLVTGLTAAGFEPDGRGFAPHITLGREVVSSAAPWDTEAFGQTVTSIDLMRSERINEKLTYTAVYTKRAEPAEGSK